jgi:ketosteroid isomerase-like protein
MSSLNIQTVQELYAAFQRRDLNAILAVLSPDVEWSEPENPFNPSGGTDHVQGPSDRQVSGVLRHLRGGGGVSTVTFVTPRIA